MADWRLTLDRRIVVFGHEAAKLGKVQVLPRGLQLVAPTECVGPVAEDSKTERTTVEEPYDNRSLSARTDHRMARLAVGATHSPHDRRRVQQIEHAPQAARQIPGRNMPFSPETKQRPSWKASHGQTKVIRNRS
jgi:hypothetical protein